MPLSLCNRIILSRFFHNNVKLVANMCTRCYEESEDVRIISVNLIFLKQTSNFKDLIDSFDFLTVVVATADLKEENECGFHRDEIELSLKYSETLNEIVNNKKQAIALIENNFIRGKSLPLDKGNITGVFKGFSDKDINDSISEQQNVNRACERIRYKVYQRVDIRLLRNICRNRISKSYRYKKQKRKILREEQTNNSETTESESKYFSITFENNNTTTVRVKEEYSTGDNIKVEMKCEYCNSNGTCVNTCATKVKIDEVHIDYESQYFKGLQDRRVPYKLETFIKPEIGRKKDGFEDGVVDENPPLFIPPRSPHNLIEERLYHDPWALLVATIFLNRTSCMCARPHVFWFLQDNPDPLSVLDKFPKDLEKYFVNLGLQTTRAVQIWRMSHDFVYKRWNNVKELYGIGTYGEDAFRMFCLGDFSVEPKDRFLKIYKAWYQKVALQEGLA